MTGSAKNQNALLKLFDPGRALSVDQLSDWSGISRHETIKAAGLLINRGYLDREERGVFKLTEAGTEALQNGVEIKSGPMGPDTGKARKPFDNTVRQRAWSAMRVMGIFSTSELAAVACDAPTENDHANLRRYCRALAQAGFLFEMPIREQGAAESSNGFKRYRLLNDTGEVAPTYRNTKKEVFDHNTGAVFQCEDQSR